MHSLLAPDGTRVLTVEYPDRFVLLDLTTGVSTTMKAAAPWTSNVGASVQLLAWSPDGHRVAYAVPAPPPADGRPESSMLAGRPIMELAVLNLLDGSSRRGPTIQTAWSAAYSPDGRTLAVQTGPGQAWIMTPEGGQIRPLEVPDGRELIPGVAFSPDGALLATVAPDTASSTRRAIGFVDATGAGRPVPADIPYEYFLGWRSPSSVVVQLGIAGPTVLAEVSLRDGAVTVLSRFIEKTTCEHGLQTCYPYRIQLASGLLPVAGVRPSDPDHGPWPLRVWVWGVVITLETAGVAMWLGLALRRRAKRR